MNDYAFGNFLYALRTEKGLSQVQLGDMLGVTNKAVSKWENGSAKPNTVLIPKLAEILGVTVEELFACKRFEIDHEYESIKKHLSSQKRKLATYTSVFLSLAMILPLLLIEFILVVVGFWGADDTVGPLGSVCIIVAYIISVTAFLIYRGNFRRALTPSKIEYTAKYVGFLKKGLAVTSIAGGVLFVFIPPTYLLLAFLSHRYLAEDIFLAIAAFVWMIIFGAFVYFANVKRLLNIQFSPPRQNMGQRIRFSEHPMWWRICYISVIALWPVLGIVQILTYFISSITLVFTRLALGMLWFGAVILLVMRDGKRSSRDDRRS
jgi:transcriptional regulator with XRE-family HTH domain